MRHPGYEVELAPLRDFFQTAVDSGHVFVISESVERRKPRIAVAVIEHQLPLMCGKSRQVRGHGISQRLTARQRFFLDIHFHRSWCRSEDARPWRENSTDAAAAGGYAR